MYTHDFEPLQHQTLTEQYSRNLNTSDPVSNQSTLSGAVIYWLKCKHTKLNYTTTENTTKIQMPKTNTKYTRKKTLNWTKTKKKFNQKHIN